ncbi:hypothetical protein EDC01DRAFT_635356 [Geopyxis carbonaria]|nr:hypothetical protein EDC01DRAFT_635356 [Geopyxis carbonaria]
MRYSLLSLLAINIMWATMTLQAPTDVPFEGSVMGLGITYDPSTIQDLPILDFGNLTANDPATTRANIVCETTTGSPRLHDIDKVVQILITHSTAWCYNNNNWGSHCTRNAFVNRLAAASLCGSQARMNCGDMGREVKTIKDRCTWTMYAGGQSLLVAGLRVVLHKK